MELLVQLLFSGDCSWFNNCIKDQTYLRTRTRGLGGWHIPRTINLPLVVPRCPVTVGISQQKALLTIYCH